MRVWSLHPRFLDGKGLVACWRETLLAQAVLAGRTRGYTRHPQLVRFRAQDDPLRSVDAYLVGLADAADLRGFRFDRTRIDRSGTRNGLIAVTDGQLAYEWAHLQAKLAERSPQIAARWHGAAPESHPLFHVVPGPVEDWERPTPSSAQPRSLDSGA
ncbi:MAG: pyrimidine dimer DNA glycosylase/endonuclease V [Microbacterium sp.]|uniref:pyrimidine dimer DNA glycosylase/endonuclease V n=1 Tax=Microbacterium sp. TaxID=51671 RepID=UPI0039E4F215